MNYMNVQNYTQITKLHEKYIRWSLDKIDSELNLIKMKYTQMKYNLYKIYKDKIDSVLNLIKMKTTLMKYNLYKIYER